MGWHCQQWRHWLWSDASTLYETPASGCSQKLHEGRAVVLPFIVSNTCKLKYNNTKPSVTQSWKQRIHFIADTVVVMELLKFHIWLSHNFPCHMCPQVGTQLSTCFIVQLIIHWNYFTTLFWTHWKRPKKNVVVEIFDVIITWEYAMLTIYMRCWQYAMLTIYIQDIKFHLFHICYVLCLQTTISHYNDKNK